MGTSDLFSTLEQILPLMAGYAFLMDKDSHYKACTRSQALLFGLKAPKDIVNQTNKSLPLYQKHPELLNTLDAINQQLMALKDAMQFDEPVKTQEGKLIVIKYHKIPLFDNKSQLVGILSLLVDEPSNTIAIPSHSSNEIALKHILTHLPEHVYWKNKQGQYLGCNLSQAIDLSLTNCDEIIGKTDYDLSTKEEADLFWELDKKVLALGLTIDAEEEIIKNGEIRTVLSKKAPLYDELKQIIGLLGISFDITDRKKMEEELKQAKNAAEAANSAKTEFLTNMRHDIRTPLSGIVGFSELLKFESNESGIQEYADNLIASSHALLHLMDEVLEAIRVSSGEIPKLKKKFILHRIMQHAIDLNKAKAASKRLDFSMEFDKEIPQYLIGDSVRIHRIVLELLANALNFTDAGFVKLTVTLASRQNREVVIKLMVQDSGMGIPKDKQQEIFLHFKRLTPSYQGIYKGAGLGLSVIKQFIDDLDGEIYVDSEVQQGSTFTCVVPLKVSLLEDDTGLLEDFEEDIAMPSSQITTPSKIATDQAAETQDLKHRILVVEDNFIAQKVAKSILVKSGCSVDLASNGQEALDLWKQNEYDLVLMDIGLPDLDGYQVTHHIRVREVAKNRHTPIIALTAHVGDENKQRCIESGMNAVLSKPLTKKSCDEILSSFIPQKQGDESTPSSWASDLPETEEELFDLLSFPILDVEEGIKTNGSEETFGELLEFMLDSLPDDLTQLKKAHDTLDWEKTQKLAHKIKGGVVYVGAVRMKMACQYLERYWKTGHRSLLERLYQQMLQVTNESIVEFKQWMKNRLPS